ncbi:hypothetical protein JD77_06124 [Micromonospora olivasterospora]|uniref:Uncharacterized protein n=1 Tax=Micromonospora olivasterospora TaxID=1880 RepID=A0A562IJC4_MICOL|nr:hypothetical protein JD77_06124 [Micromonospora olivasterospora]
MCLESAEINFYLRPKAVNVSQNFERFDKKLHVWLKVGIYDIFP